MEMGSAKGEVRTGRDHRVAAVLAAILAGATALLMWAGSAHGTEYTGYAPLDAEAEVAASPALVNVPAGWQAGDPAVMVLVAGPDRDRLRGRLVADMLAARAAVVELSFAPDLTDPSPMARDAHRALSALDRAMAPGQVVLFGFGWDVGGYAAQLAADPSVREQMTGVDGPVFSAHATLGMGCETATPYWDEPGEWRLNAIHQGEQLWHSDLLVGTPAGLDAAAAALACGMALLPSPAQANPVLPVRAAR